MNSGVTPSTITPAPPPRRRVGQFVLFAAVAFGPIVVLYALGYWAAVDSLRYELESSVDPMWVVGLVVLLLVALVGTYLLWKRARDRLVRGVVLLTTYELLFFALALFLNTYLLTGTPRLDWPGHPFVPALGMAAAVLFYGQALVFPLVVVVTMAIGGQVLAATGDARRKTGFGAVLLAVLVAVLPPAVVAATHMRFVEPIRTGPWRARTLADAAEDICRAMKRYAAAHAGLYPPGGVSWEPGDSTSMAYWFQPYDDGWHRDSSNTPDGHLPDNPFSGRRYRVGVDFFYFPDRLEHSGDNQRISTEKGHVPFAGMKAPKGRPGTIVILGYTPPDAAASGPTEYALVVYRGDVAEPWHNSRHYKDYVVGYGPKADSDSGRE